MPAGHDTPQEQVIINALIRMLAKKGTHLTYEQGYTYYIDLLDNFQNSGQDVVTTGKDGKLTINQDFVTAFAKYAETGANPYGADSTTTNTTGPGGIPLPPPGPTQTGPTPKQRMESRQNRRADYRMLLSNWGIPLTGNLQQLIAQATQNHYNQSQFIQYLRQTPEYHQQFAGIFDANGNLKMTEGQYMQQDQQYERIMTSAGLNYSNNLKTFLFRNNVSVAQAQQRAAGIAAVKQNPELFKQFSAELVREGLAQPGDVTEHNVLRWAMGDLTNAKWTELWQNAAARNAAVQGGLRIAKNSGLYASLTRAQVLGIADKGFSSADMQKGFAEAAQQFLTVLPESRIQGYGLTKNKILQAVFGGKDAAKVQQKIQHIMATDEAFYQQRAVSQTAVDQTGKRITLSGQETHAQSL